MQNIEILGLDKFKGRNVLRDFYINTLADHLETSHQHIEKPHKHDFYATMVFTSGSGAHHIDFNTYEVRAGSAFAMSPGQVHSWELSPDADGFIFFHTKSFYEMRYSDETLSEYVFFSPAATVNAIDVPPRDRSEFGRLFSKMSEASARDEKSKRHLIIALITQVYIDLQRFSDPDSSNKTSVYVQKSSGFLRLLEDHFKSEKSPEKYASMLHISARHLNRINRETTGKPTSEIIIERVLLEAKRMLVHSDGNFNEIASALGYDDYAYFSKLFRKKTGMTPSQFQKHFR